MKNFLRIAAKTVVLIAETPRIQASAIAIGVGISRRYMEPTLQKLVHAGVLSSIRGPGGGYLIARPFEQITLLDLAQANPSKKNDPFRGADQPGVDRIFDWLDSQRLDALSRVTLASLVSQKIPA